MVRLLDELMHSSLSLDKVREMIGIYQWKKPYSAQKKEERIKWAPDLSTKDLTRESNPCHASDRFEGYYRVLQKLDYRKLKIHLCKEKCGQTKSVVKSMSGQI